MSEQDEFIKEFVLECHEGLDRLDNDLVELEENPRDTSRLDSAFRTLHTIKGNAGFLDFVKLGEVAHAGETLMGRLRGGELELNRDNTDALLEMLDALRAMVKEVSEVGNEGSQSFSGIKSKLVKLADQNSESEGASEGSGPPTHAATLVTAAPNLTQQLRSDDTDAKFESELRVKADKPGASSSAATLNYESDLLAAAEPATAGEPVDASAASAKQAAVSNPPAETAQRPDTDTPPEPPELVGEEGSARPARGGSSAPATAIRVDVDLLDHLMNLVGELVLSRNQLLRIMSSRQDVELLDPTQRINLLTSELQEGVMRTRMQQIGSIWQRYPRMVRDFSRQCNKDVKLVMSGGETELDKSLLEAIGDPLIHLIRNAIDHGIEKPYLRRVKCKPEQGSLTMRAFHEGGQVHIEIADDGAGLDLEKIKEKAIQRGLISADVADSISAAELSDSIFMAGFSTAEQITNVSGRGVGMDVVKTSIEEVGGTIEIDTERDVGTTFRLTVPLTLAIVPALIIRSGEQQFAVPQINVVELLGLQSEEVAERIEWFHNAPVLRLRGELLPVVSLSKELQLVDEALPADRASVLVLKTGTRQFALVVDQIGNSQEIVVKPLGTMLKGLQEYAGATVMGDGSVALILDVLGVARRTGLFASDKSLERAVQSSLAQDRTSGGDESLLVAEIEGQRRVAVPLANVIRLEDVAHGVIEQSATQEVLQYRGEILPVVRLAKLFGGATAGEDGPLKVIIYSHEGQQLGMGVARIVDIAERPEDHRASTDAMIATTAIVGGRVTDVLDVEEVIRAGNVRFFEAAPA